MSFLMGSGRSAESLRAGFGMYAVVALVAAMCYVNCLDGQFVHDDVMAIVRNPDVSTNSLLSDVWHHDYWGRDITSDLSHKSYRPLTVLTFRFDYFFSAMHPRQYHVTNVLLHMIASVLFTVLCHDVVHFDWLMSFCAGVLFAVHPVHTEAVSNVVGRGDVLCCVFYVAGLLGYISLSRAGPMSLTRRCLWLGVSLLCGVGATLSKETGLTLYVIFLLYDLFPVTICRKPLRLSSKLVISVAMTLLMMSMTLLLRLSVMQWTFPVFTRDDNPASFHPTLLVRLMTYAQISSINIRLLVEPSSLSYDWSMDRVPLVADVTDLRNVYTVITFCLLLGGAVSTFTARRQVVSSNAFVLGYGVFVTSLLPTTNLFGRVGFVVAERLLYMPSIGFIIIVVDAIRRVRIAMPRQGPFIFSCLSLVVLSYAARTITRNRVWSSRSSLFRSGVEMVNANAKQHYNYGNLLKDEGAMTEAQHHYQEAIKRWPDYASAINNLATLEINQTAAELLYRRAIAKQLCHANAHFNLGNLLVDQERYGEATLSLWSSITCDPHSSLPHSSLAAMYRALRHVLLANWHYNQALVLSPHNKHASYNYCSFQRENNFAKSGECSKHCADERELEVGNFQTASSLFDDRDLLLSSTEQMLSQDNIRLSTVKHWSNMYGLTEKHTMAIEFLEAALNANMVDRPSDCADVHYMLGRHLQDIGHATKAIAHYEMAVKMDPEGDLSDAKHRLAIHYHLHGKYPEAMTYYKAALQTDSNNVLIHENLTKLRKTFIAVLQREARNESTDHHIVSNTTGDNRKTFLNSFVHSNFGLISDGVSSV